MSTREWREHNKERQLKLQREWYSRNTAIAKSWVRDRKIKLAEWFAAYKRTLRCARCGESHPACLDFHHKNPLEKDVALSQVIYTKGWSKERILNEISKCEVLCSNCHRKEHYNSEQI